MKYLESDLKKIKLIIWDLDETFWRGTLSDASNVVEEIPENIDLLIDLTKRGIVNSICSKNDREKVLEKLREIGVENYFTFMSINWSPKGKRIKEQIQAMALREENVLFIDDNPFNIMEAKSFCNNLMTAAPDIIPVLKQNVNELGKYDANMTRLNQYKVLEKKFRDSQCFDTNEEFLKKSGIKLCINTDISTQMDRIYELIQRTNQLNYTKKRISEEELRAIQVNDDVIKGYVSVADNYGQYGVVGFFALCNGVLEHFLFSCRIMGMGVEQYLYAYLGFPRIDIAQPVSGELDSQKGMPEYIQLVENIASDAVDKRENISKVLLKGPCDLEIMASYIENGSGVLLTKEFNFVDENGNQQDMYNHSEMILDSLLLSDRKKRAIQEKYKFITDKIFKTSLFSGEYDVVCLSPLMDATLAVYEDKKDYSRIALGLYNKPITNKENWDDYIQGKVMTAHSSYTKDELELFASEYCSVEFTPDRVADNFSKIVHEIKRTNKNTKIIIMTLAELPYHNSNDFMQGKHVIHQSINRKLREKFRNQRDVYLLDVNEYINNQNDYFDNINHYSKLVYYKMARELLQFISGDCNIELRLKGKCVAILDNIKRMAYKMLFVGKPWSRY